MMIRVSESDRALTSGKKGTNQCSLPPPIEMKRLKTAEYTLTSSMDPGEPHLRDTMNMTRALEALSPYLKTPRRTVIQIEALVVSAVALLFLQLILGPWRRRSSHWSVQGTLWLAYTVSFPLITYTLLQMLSSPVKNVLYPFWAIFLFWAAGCSSAMTAYSLEDSKQWKRYSFELLQYVIYLSFILALLGPNLNSRRPDVLLPQPVYFPLLSLGSAVFNTNLFRIISVWMITNSNPSKLVADHMRVQVGQRGADHLQGQGQDEPFDFYPVTMKGYRYLVWPTPRFDLLFRRETIKLDDGAITIKEIWDMTFDDSLLNTTRVGSSQQLKNVCLSIALSNLLRRRFFGMDCAEAGLPETRKFALEGLFPEQDHANNYSRGFHVIEVELGFLYDLFFTKYATLFQTDFYFLFFVLLKLIITCCCGLLLLLYSPTIKIFDPIIEVGTRRVDVTITVLIMAAILLFEALQVILYLTSDWATVSLVWRYAKGPIQSDLIVSILNFLILSSKKMFAKINSFGYWQNKMGQSSLIESCFRAKPFYMNDSKLIIIIMVPVFYMTMPSFHSWVFSKKTFQEVPSLVRNDIVSCLRKYSNGGPLTNGETALHLNGDVHAEFSWTLNLRNHSQTVVMLLWHIATEYCSMASSHDQEADTESGPLPDEKMQIENYKQVATTLSRYCAYLISFVPELLPGNSTDILYVFNDVLLEGRRALRQGKPSRDELLKVIAGSESSSSGGGGNGNGNGDNKNNNTTTTTTNNNNNNSEDSIFVKGLKLGRSLEEKDVLHRWELMAEFWVETIVYIAPSDNVAAHMERLAQGGEFLTHVWALLTHAGILKRD